MHLTTLLVIAIAAGALLVLGALYDDRKNRRNHFATVVAPRIELPLLHSINDDRCIGCEACVAVCPTNVLELVNHKVVVARFDRCVQCEQCANKCPTTALVMYRAGQQPTTLTVPELDERFQTAVPGQYLIGEVAGKPLVKNAANLGRAVVEHIAAELGAGPRPDGVLDVVIVGSGPAGLSAGLTCMVRRLSCVVLEKEHVISATVARYPKGKHFMAEPSTAPNLSFLPVFDASKEVLVAAWQAMVEEVKLPIRRGEAVESVKRGDDGVFTVKTTVASYRGRTVILATGLRGKPRLLTVPGANLEKVQSRLDDAEAFAGQHVLVVGGGDSAIEAAIALVGAGATTTLSYRGDNFSRAKQANQKRLAALEASGEVSVLLKSNVAAFTADAVTIKLDGGAGSTIPNQQAFVLIGADTPVAWLEGLGVNFVERPHLYALGSSEDAVTRVVPAAVQCPRDVRTAIDHLRGRAPAAKPRRLRTVVGEVVQRVDHAVADVWHEVGTAVDAPLLDTRRHQRLGTRSELDWNDDSVVEALDRLEAPAPKARRASTARDLRDELRATRPVDALTEHSVVAVVHAPRRDATGVHRVGDLTGTRRRLDNATGAVPKFDVDGFAGPDPRTAIAPPGDRATPEPIVDDITTPVQIEVPAARAARSPVGRRAAAAGHPAIGFEDADVDGIFRRIAEGE